MSPLPVAVHELVVAPLAFGLGAWHATRALGAARAALELLVLAAYGFGLERVAIAVFASHAYGSAWRLAPLGVPIAVALVWAAVIGAAMALARRLGARAPLGCAAAAAAIGVSLDVLLEPVAVRAGLWSWTPPGPWLGVPIGNFVGWSVIIGCYTFGAERWPGPDQLPMQALKRLLLAVAAVLALVLVGLAWTHLGAERAFAGAPGWLAWAAALVGVLGLASFRRPRSTTQTLAGRLAAAPGPAPALVLILVAAAFAWDALALGEAPLGVVAAGSLAALLAAAGRGR